MPEISSKQQNFEYTLTHAFDIEKFLRFAAEFINGLNVFSSAKDFKTDGRSNFEQFVVGCYKVGSYETPKKEKLMVLAVCLKQGSNVEQARSKQRNYVKQIIREVDTDADAALVAFYTENDYKKWRLSFVRIDREFVGGKIKDKVLTPAKRYSYLVGDGEPCNTAKQCLYGIYSDEVNKITLDDLEKAFSVERVTDDFFKLYREKFLQLQEMLEKIPAFVKEAKERNFSSEQFAKKLMGQLVFLYFIQKKGWLGVDAFQKHMTEKEYNNAFYVRGQGEMPKKVMPKVYQKGPDGLYHRNVEAIMALTDEEGICLAKIVKGDAWGTGPKNFVREIFNACVGRGKNFFDDYLEPFFYTGLNKDRGSKGYYPRFRKRVPFLNGGLFEEMEGYDWENNSFNIPNEIFSNKDTKGERDADGILDIFDRFNFTMNEDEPMEKEVAIDPEMLGKVFENLLEIKDRKSKGAFYTPREIVHYMCQESLINYLTGKMGIPEKDIRDFVLYGELLKEEDTSYGFKKEFLISEQIYAPSKGINRLEELDGYLANVKVCDPAVGSGAFPLGMINEIVRARDVLTAYMAMDCGFGVGNIIRRFELYNTKRTFYALKTQTIKNCIYACDIMPSAVDIAKLRLWLSIVIEDVLSDKDDELTGEHTSPRQLPNLDCNIICGNSLMDEFMGIKLVNGETLFAKQKLGQKELFVVSRKEQINLFEDKLDGRITELMELQDKLFFEKELVQKQSIKTEIQNLYNDIVMEQLGDKPEAVEKYFVASQDISKPFVIWQLYFPRVFVENGGFDIVIGNPPYVSTKGRTAKEKNELLHCYGFADDLYSHFYFKALDICRLKGVVTFITPDTFFTTITKNNLRKLVLQNKLLELIHLGHDVFDSAMVSTAICLIQKGNSVDNVTKVLNAKGCKKLKDARHYSCLQSAYLSSINKAFFVSTVFNNKLNEIFAKKHTDLVNLYWDKIVTSAEIKRNAGMLKDYRDNLKPGDFTLLGLVTDGGVGLQTANNGKYVGYREGTKGAERVAAARVKKLAEFNKEYKCSYEMPAKEQDIWALFEEIKAKYGRDVFGQGFIYKIVPDALIANVDDISADEKLNGLKGNATFVPYDKGDKEGNRWYLETPFVIDWGRDSVNALKESSQRGGTGSARFQNTQFYFREGFCYSDIKTFFLKARKKGISVHDVKSMSLFPLIDKLPEYYLIMLINTEIIATFVYNFLNNTPSFQINDCKMLPVFVPTDKQLEECKILFEQLETIQKKYFAGIIDSNEKEAQLSVVQDKVELWACDLYGISPELLRGQENYVR